MIVLFPLSLLAGNKKIVVSIRPLQSIVANIMGDQEEINLIIDHNESLHNYQLKPTKIRNIYSNNLIIIMSRNFEVFMDRILENLSAQNKVIEVANLPGVELLLNNEHNQYGLKYDYHLWLDVDQVRTIARGLTDILIKEYPSNKNIYKNNLAQFELKLTALNKRIIKKLKHAHNKDFMVTHNAYSYFTKQYHLNNPTAITIDHDHNIGARSFLEMQNLIKENKIQCIFEEPQFDSQIILKLQEKSNIRIGKLDAEWGPDNASTKDAYFAMMDSLADSFSECLK
jgi:zinc transport system substrate-binding protein